MELTTDLVVRSRPASISANSTVVSLRRPTPADWQRWKPTIAARYKSVPARVIIQEMNAVHLFVSEKLFRDRLRQWGLNDKNQFAAGDKRGRAKRSMVKSDRVSNQQKCRPRLIGDSSLRRRLFVDAQVQSSICTSKEARTWQQALKGVLDWQQHLESSAAGIDQSFVDAGRYFTHLLWEIWEAVDMVTSTAWSCRIATRRLKETSAAVNDHLESSCTLSTPLSVLHAASFLLRFANFRGSRKWYDTASRFLVKMAAETLPALHPTLLLLKALLFDGSNLEGLAMIYEVGFSTVERFYEFDDSVSKAFLFDFLNMVLITDPNSAFGSYADVLCADSSDSEEAGQLFSTALLHENRNRFAEADQCLRRCLARLEDEGIQNTLMAYKAWWFLSILQYKQCNVTGEENSLLEAQQVILALESNKDCELEPSVLMSRSVSELYAFYERIDRRDRCDALRLEYSRVFEL